MIKKIIALLLSTSFVGISQQDLKKNYSPLKSKGELPEVFTQNIRSVIKKDIIELKSNKEQDRGLKTQYLTASNYEIEKIVKSGNTLINDEITTYLNQITDIILRDNKALRQQLKVFTLKSSAVNAYSFDKGYTFINIGLIAQAETEAQLAYILCHEISHYTKRHNINSYVQNAKIDRQNYNGGDNEEKIIEKCQYSKENESEADIEGFKLFERTTYNLKQAEKSFDMLQYAHLPFELVEIKKTFFETEGFIIPKSYFLKDVSGIKDNSNEDDTKSTHPNTKKRKQAVRDIVANRDNSSRVNALVSQEKFEYIRDLARMELCRLYLKNRDYPNALYAAYILALKYPNNEYVAEIISKCMYSLALVGKGDIGYNHDSYLEGGIPAYTNIESYPQQLYHLISKMPSNEWTIMSLNMVYRAHKKYPDNKVISTLSDSLFGLMKRTAWGVSEFPRVKRKPTEVLPQDSSKTVVAETKTEGNSKTDLIANLQKERNTKVDDTVYYKDVFVDLFMGDQEFADKFPSSGIIEPESTGFTVFRPNSNKEKAETATKKKKTKEKIIVGKVVLLEPFFIEIDETRRDGVRYISSDKKQEDYSALVKKCSQKLEFELITIDPGMLSSGEVDRMNDYSVMNDWFDEKFDADKEKTMVLNTDDMSALIAKYGTQYVLKTGIATVTYSSGKKRTFFYGFLFDVKTNELVYRKYEYFKTKDRQDLVSAKTYQMLYELKRPIKK